MKALSHHLQAIRVHVAHGNSEEMVEFLYDVAHGYGTGTLRYLLAVIGKKHAV